MPFMLSDTNLGVLVRRTCLFAQLFWIFVQKLLKYHNSCCSIILSKYSAEQGTAAAIVKGGISMKITGKSAYRLLSMVLCICMVLSLIPAMPMVAEAVATPTYIASIGVA